MTVHISGSLSEFAASNFGENGSSKNISDCVRDLKPRHRCPNCPERLLVSQNLGQDDPVSEGSSQS